MKKIGIITYHFANNYGAVLQCYALQTYLAQRGFKVTVFNFISEKQAKNNDVIKHGKSAKSVIANICLLPFSHYIRKKHKSYQKFCQKDLNITPHFTEVRDLQKYIENNGYDFIVSGSDQVLNPNIDDFELIDGVAPAIQKINESGYLAIVVTNQPVIARGEVSFDELEEIHNKMETLLGKEGAYLDAIYYCPHHPHKGYEGERPELKIECKCRKPKPGMLLKAAEEFNIDLSQSWMIGDGENDVIAGINAGCKTVLLSDDDKNYGQTETMKSLDEFTKSLF